MADHGNGASLHIAVFPWLAFGHMLPFLRLSKSLAKRRHRVSFLSTPRNIARLPKLPPDVAPFIDFVPLPLPPVEQLPPDAESTNDLLPEQVQYLKKALDGLQSPFACFLRSTKPDWVILDFCQHWAPAIAAEVNVPCAHFSIIRASSKFFFCDLNIRPTSPPTPEEFTKTPESVPFPTTIAFRLHEAECVICLYRDNASGISDVQRLTSVLKGSDLVAFRSCLEHESSWLSLFDTRFCSGNVVPVGLLPTPEDEQASQVEADPSSSTILLWLSEQLPRRVIYVAIGSEATLSADQESELASGLELSAVPFLWAVRKPSGSGTGGGARRHRRGLVIEGWVPQLDILRHNSVGAFLTHCGYSSVIESLEFGLPLVMLPSIIDTGLIARWCAEMKVGEEVARNEADGSFTGEDVAAAIRKVMVEEEGAALFRSSAEKQREVFADTKLHESYVDSFIQRLRSQCSALFPIMADHGNGASLHIAVFPWLAFGHMLPFLRLSKSLAKRRHRVSFLSTPRNIARLPKLPPDVAPFIDFVPLPLPPVEHLPPDAESTNDLLPEQVQYLKKALDGLQSPFACFLRSTKPDWVILDFCQHWAPAIAAEVNVPCAYFSIFRASSLFFFSDKITRPSPEEFTKPPVSVPFPTTIALRLHEAKGAIWAYRENASGISDVQRIVSVLKSSNLVAFRSCFEHESSWLSLFETRFCAGDVMPVGLLPTPADELASQAEAESSSSTTTILRWLSEQLPRSVVYVAIGSEATLSAEQERELASGLELSAVPFLWAVRKPSGSGTGGGGGSRRLSHGLVIEGWVPQLEILQHHSVGAFLTHCGCSSVIEGLQFGLPLVMLPLVADTGLIARWCAEMKVGEEVARNEADGSFTEEDVAAAVRKVMVEEEGAALFRSNAEKQREVVADTKLHESYVDSFIQRLRSK